MADFMGFMKQAASQLQSKMEALQQELELIEVDGTAGGGLVTVKLTAKSELKAVSIDPSLLKPDDKGVLEDLLIAAHAEARRRAEKLLQDRMQQLTGGLPLPPGLKLF
jgi:nucleoid-associated protein EbfC